MSESQTARPKTSTRDYDDLRKRLEVWLGDRLEGDPRISALDVPPGNGMSSDTVLFDATWSEGGATRTQELVARVAPESSAVPVFPVYDLDRQFRVMRLVHELTPVPVPKVWWSEPEVAPLGAPFFVMERVHGLVPPDIMPYPFGDNWLYDASRDDQRRLQDSSIQVLADLHAVPDPERHFDFLQLDRPGDTPLRRHFADLQAYYAWAIEGMDRSPLTERAFAWLDEHWPPDEGPTVLSWGDARIGNVMYRDFEPVAVFDWEMAALAPRELDLGWFIYLHRFFEDLATDHGFGGMPHFLRRDDVAATYAELTGHAPRHLDFYTAYAATRHAVVSIRTSRRGVFFGEREMPDDVDDLIMHRRTLEAMLAGTYWESISGA